MKTIAQILAISLSLCLSLSGAEGFGGLPLGHAPRAASTTYAATEAFSVPLLWSTQYLVGPKPASAGGLINTKGKRNHWRIRLWAARAKSSRSQSDRRRQVPSVLAIPWRILRSVGWKTTTAFIVFAVVAITQARQAIIEPFSMPRDLQGLYTAEALARRVNQEIDFVFQEGRQYIGSDPKRPIFVPTDFSLREDAPDLKLPGFDYGMGFVTSLLHKTPWLKPPHVSGDIDFLPEEMGKELSKRQARVRMSIREGDRALANDSLVIPMKGLDSLALPIAEAIVKATHPTVYANYLFTQKRDESGALDILSEHPPKTESDKLLALAIRITILGRNRRWVETNKLFEEAWNLDRKNARLLWPWAVTLHNLGRTRKAIDKLQLLLKVRPEFSAYTYFDLGAILQQTGDTTGALTAYHQAIAADPKNMDFYDALASLLNRQGKIDEVIALRRQQIRADPENPYVYLTLRDLFLELKRPKEEGIAVLRQGLAIDKTGVVATELGDMFAYAAEDSLKRKAIGYYRDALRVAPGNPFPYGHLGRLLISQGQEAKAEELYSQEMKAMPGFSSPYYDLGQLRQRQNRLEEAAILFHKAIDLTSRPGLYDRDLIEVLKRQGKFGEVVAICQQLIQRFPLSHYGYLFLADFQASRGHLSEARKTLKDAITSIRKAALLETNEAQLARGQSSIMVLEDHLKRMSNPPRERLKPRNRTGRNISSAA